MKTNKQTLIKLYVLKWKSKKVKQKSLSLTYDGKSNFAIFNTQAPHYRLNGD